MAEYSKGWSGFRESEDPGTQQNQSRHHAKITVRSGSPEKSPSLVSDKFPKHSQKGVLSSLSLA